MVKILYVTFINAFVCIHTVHKYLYEERDALSLQVE